MRNDKFVMAQINKKNIINLIRKNGPINKAELAKLSGLSIPTVMKITNEFIHNGLIRVIGKGKSHGGKRPELLELIQDAYYIIGVDMGRSRTTVIMMDLGGNLISKRVMNTGDTFPAEGLLNRTVYLVKQIVLDSGIEEEKILGLGIGTPGVLNPEKGEVVFSPDFMWENVSVTDVFEKEFHIPVYLENSNRTLAVGEKWFGVAVCSDNFICLNLGHGIGSAIVEDGEMYSGTSGSSGEIGHLTLEKNGPLCQCGNYGCLEALASGNAIASQAKKYIADGNKTMILEMAQYNVDDIDAKEVFDAAKAGDEAANEIIRKAIEYIGIALAGYINLMDPDLVVLAGGIVNAGDIFVENLKAAIKSRQMKYAGRKVKIEVAKLGQDAAAIGAATIILKRFVEMGAAPDWQCRREENV